MKLAVEELADLWREDESGEYIQVNEDCAYYVAHGRVMERIQKAYGNIWAGIRQWSKDNSIWLNIWSISDHGNVTLHDDRGHELGGLV